MALNSEDIEKLSSATVLEIADLVNAKVTRQPAGRHGSRYEIYTPINPDPKHVRLLQFLTNRLPNGGTFVDAGIGAGVPARVVSDLGYTVYGIDCSRFAGDWISSFADSAVKCIDIALEEEPIPLEDETVDCIYFGATLEHLHNSPRPILMEFKRILRPGGYVFIDVPNFVCLRHRVLMLMGRSVMPSAKYVYDSEFHDEHHREYTLEETTNIVTWAGFEIDQAYLDDVAFQRSLIRRGKMNNERDSGEGFTTSASVWDYNLPFNLRSSWDWIKILIRPLLKVFPSLRDDIVVVGRKPD